MGPVHVYLAAWVTGGVLLGASMLLDSRERELHEAQLSRPEPLRDGMTVSSDRISLGEADVLKGDTPARQSPLLRGARGLPFGLIGFGLCGLTAKGLNLDFWPWTFVCSLGVGACLIAIGYRLSRARTL